MQGRIRLLTHGRQRRRRTHAGSAENGSESMGDAPKGVVPVLSTCASSQRTVLAPVSR
jgi:hypothetical protein